MLWAVVGSAVSVMPRCMLRRVLWAVVGSSESVKNLNDRTSENGAKLLVGTLQHIRYSTLIPNRNSNNWECYTKY